jgi:hypothetical protein
MREGLACAEVVVVIARATTSAPSIGASTVAVRLAHPVAPIAPTAKLATIARPLADFS